MDEFDCAWRTGLLVRLQQPGGDGGVDWRTKRFTAHDNGHVARVGPGSATGNLERGEARTFARPSAFLGHTHFIGDSGSCARSWLVDSDSAEWMVPDWRARQRWFRKFVADQETKRLGDAHGVAGDCTRVIGSADSDP